MVAADEAAAAAANAIDACEPCDAADGPPPPQPPRQNGRRGDAGAGRGGAPTPGRETDATNGIPNIAAESRRTPAEVPNGGQAEAPNEPSLPRAPLTGARAAVAAAAARFPVRHYITLTNGIEALPLLIDGGGGAGIPRDAVRFCRIQSSHCEARDFAAVLGSLDDDLLLHLALGVRCRVYDFGSRRKRWPGEGLGLMVPSALWWGVEVARYVLTKLWHLPSAPDAGGGGGASSGGGGGGQEAVEAAGAHGRLGRLHGHDAHEMLDGVVTSLPQKLSRRLKYYRPYVATDTLRLEGVFAPTALDGQRDEYAARLWAAYLHDGPTEAAADGTASAAAEQPPPPLPAGMQIFDPSAYGHDS